MKDRRELAAAYALAELGSEERAALERRLVEDAELRTELAATRELVAELERLPAEAWPGEEAAAKPASALGGRRAQRWSLRPALAVAALLVALAAGGLGGVLLSDGGGGRAEAGPTLSLHSLDGLAEEQATVSMPAPDEMQLNALGLPPSRPGEYYEVWLMSSASRTVPVASFRVGADGTATVRVPLPADPAGYRYFDVSRQLVSGGTAHSADSVLRGPTS